jgi:kynurenine formamidase
MCSPEVARIVRERIEKEGLPHLIHRTVTRAGGLAAALAFLTVKAQGQAEDASSEVIDLTHVFGMNNPVYSPGQTPVREALITVEKDGCYIQHWSFAEHTGTHVDIPAHFVAGGTTVDDYPADLLISPAVVIDIAAKAAANNDSMLEVADIEAWESANGEIPAGSVVLMYSGWDVRWSAPETFRNADADGVQHYPGFSPEAAKFLVKERDIRGIGVDTLSLDTGNATKFDVHVTILGAGKYGIEGLNNLALIKGRQATVIVGVPRWEAGSGGPARILAMV